MVGLVVAAQPVGEAQQAYALRTRTIVREIPALGPVIRPRSPFRGLKPYQEGDAEVFFGREDDITAVVAALYASRTVTVYGPSGCGKSSLARAGVVPRIRADGHEALVFNAGDISSIRFVLATELHEACGRSYGVDKIESWLRDHGLGDTLHRVRRDATGDLVIVLDQAEALLNRTPAEIDELVDVLFTRLSGVRVLVTLRSDLVDAVLRHPKLGPALLGGRTVPLAPMTAGQLEEVITKPVERLPAVSYEPGLVRRMLDDAGDEPGILPLLGFVLEQLWERQDGGHLRNAAYEELGRVSGALEQHADETWKRLFAGRQERERAARRLLTRLVRMLPDGGILLRRRLTRDEVDDQQWRIATELAEARLLVLHGGEGEQESAELAHEALITAWPALRDQVEKDRRFLAGQAELEQDLRRHERGGPLLTGAQLAAVEQWSAGREGDLTEEQRRFIAMSQKRDRADKRRGRLLRTAVAAAVALIAGLATFGVTQSQATAEREKENTSRILASSIEGLLESDPGLAALAAVAAYRVAPTQEAVNALLQRYEALNDAAWMLSGFQGEIMNMAMSADGSALFGVSKGGRGTMFHRQAGGKVLRKHLGLPGNATFPLISGDVRRIAYTLDGSDSMYWHDVRYTERDIVLGPAQRLPGAALRKFTLGGRDGGHNVVSFSPGARRIATAAFEGQVRVWDLVTRRLQNPPKRLPKLRQVWFGPDEHTLVGTLLTDDEPLVRIDLRTGAVWKFERDVHALLSPRVDISADGSVAVVCRKPAEKAVYRVFRVADGRELTRYVSTARYSVCHDPAMSATGDRIAVNEGSGTWVIVGDRASTPPQRFTGPDITSIGKMGPLLGTPEEPVVVQRGQADVRGWRLHGDAGLGAFNPPVLLRGGQAAVFRTGKRGGKIADRLVVAEVEGKGRTLGSAPIPPVPSDANHLLATNRSQTLVADVSGSNKITVYTLPDLREVSTFTARLPSRDSTGSQPEVNLVFLSDDEIVTVSGTVVEHWNARDGRRISEPIDLRGVFKGGLALNDFQVLRHYKPGYIQVAHRTSHSLHAVSLATGKEEPNLRIRLGDDMVTAMVEPSGRYAMVLTRGSVIELWAVADRQNPRKIYGGLGPLAPESSQVGRMEEDGDGNPGFFLTFGRFVHFLRLTGSGEVNVEAYSFSGQQKFMASADEGRTLLRDRGEFADVLRVDPELWASRLCAILGRDLDAEERRGLPRDVPETVCPSA
ncbi:NACHT and WD repeat domain-containing protein [Nonomuraea sp. N2-4H]|uniref:NACHT and WD repeat domain-containing protein n=1 Tax=Nonomuraea sp. N2-4H TaxID=3128898 RepID=UPI003244D7A1